MTDDTNLVSAALVENYWAHRGHGDLMMAHAAFGIFGIEPEADDLTAIRRIINHNLEKPDFIRMADEVTAAILSMKEAV